MRVFRIGIVMVSLALTLTMVGCDDLFSNDEPYSGNGGDAGNGDSSLEMTCHAPHVSICIEYRWANSTYFTEAKDQCLSDSRNSYSPGHVCPVRTRVGCLHDSERGKAWTYAYFDRDDFVVDTVEGVKRACVENGGTVTESP